MQGEVTACTVRQGPFLCVQAHVQPNFEEMSHQQARPGERRVSGAGLQLRRRQQLRAWLRTLRRAWKRCQRGASTHRARPHRP